MLGHVVIELVVLDKDRKRQNGVYKRRSQGIKKLGVVKCAIEGSIQHRPDRVNTSEIGLEQWTGHMERNACRGFFGNFGYSF